MRRSTSSGEGTVRVVPPLQESSEKASWDESSAPCRLCGKSVLAAVTIPANEALELCKILKTAFPSEAWTTEKNHGAYQMAFGVVCSPPRHGLVIQIYINQGHRIKRRTVNFGLWDSTSGIQARVYQLTIADANSPTHREENEVWYGSHQHLGDKAEKLSHLNQVDFGVALDFFCKKISLALEEPISDPLLFNLTS